MPLKKVGRPRLGKRALSGAQRVAAFADAQRAEGKKRLSVWISEKADADLRAIARLQGLSVGDALEQVIAKAKSER